MHHLRGEASGLQVEGVSPKVARDRVIKQEPVSTVFGLITTYPNVKLEGVRSKVEEEDITPD